MKEMEKVYDPHLIERKWYEFWLEKELFHAEVNPQKKPYTIVIPPPNVTDILHMGHVLNNTLQDVMIRFKSCRALKPFGFREQIMQVSLRKMLLNAILKSRAKTDMILDGRN